MNLYVNLLIYNVKLFKVVIMLKILIFVLMENVDLIFKSVKLNFWNVKTLTYKNVPMVYVGKIVLF